MQTSIVEQNYRTFTEGTSGQLDDKENFLVEVDTATENGVKLLTTVGNEIGVMQPKLQAGYPDVNIRLLGKSGTVKVIQSAAIGKGVRVIADAANLGKVKALPGTTGTYRSLGRKFSEGAGAAGDVIELNDVIETIIVP